MGHTLLEVVSEEAGAHQAYDERILRAHGALPNMLCEAVADYGTICVGATRSTAVAQALFGSIPEEIGEKCEGTVAIARDAQYKPRSVPEGLIDWLSG